MWESKILTEAFLTELRYRASFNDVIQKQTPKTMKENIVFSTLVKGLQIKCLKKF